MVSSESQDLSRAEMLRMFRKLVKRGSTFDEDKHVPKSPTTEKVETVGGGVDLGRG